MVLKFGKLWKLTGIISAAAAKPKILNNRLVKVCDLANYMIYTDVAKYHDWIHRVILESFPIVSWVTETHSCSRYFPEQAPTQKHHFNLFNKRH
jgi:hypothetical protein